MLEAQEKAGFKSQRFSDPCAPRRRVARVIIMVISGDIAFQNRNTAYPDNRKAALRRRAPRSAGPHSGHAAHLLARLGESRELRHPGRWIGLFAAGRLICMIAPSISRYPVPKLEDLPEDIRARMLEVQEKAGFIPNVFLTLAHRPEDWRAFLI